MGLGTKEFDLFHVVVLAPPPLFHVAMLWFMFHVPCWRRRAPQPRSKAPRRGGAAKFWYNKKNEKSKKMNVYGF